MTGTRRTTEGLDARRRKALYHAWHRGIREMDLLLGNFADAFISELSDADLAEFERLMEVPDHDLFGWISGQADVAANHNTDLFRRIRNFHTNNRGTH
jgi:antitoxin CptB